MILTKIIIYSFSIFLFSLLLENSAYAGCTVEGTMTKAKITTEATEGNDVTTCDVSGLTDLSSVFINITGFNQDISAWDTSNVTTMASMFKGATNFNQDISDWDVSSVTDMGYMFQNARAFNQDISDWDVSSVSRMWLMFYQASAFNNGGVALTWTTSSLQYPNYMFAQEDSSAYIFNQDIGGWDMTKVLNSQGMFKGNTAFNIDIGSWDMGLTTAPSLMFAGATAFNQDISDWDMSSATSFENMFNGASAFNNGGAALTWNTSSVLNMHQAFVNATSFNQNLGVWDVSNATNVRMMLANTALSTSNYDLLLVAWDALDLTDSLRFDTSANYTGCSTAAIARANIVSTDSWTINDSGATACSAPTLSSSTPADNATGIAENANIVLTFSLPVDVESGNITIKKTSDNSTVETIAVTNSKVTGTGTTQITINPATTLGSLTEYYVLIDATGFDNSNSDSYAGISSTTALSFTTGDNIAPSINSSSPGSPADNATGVAVDSNIVINFVEAVDAESGNITIHLTSNNSTIETIDVTGGQVSGSGTTQITINPGSDFSAETEYYVLIAGTAFDDGAGHSYAGISSTTALSFTTVDVTNPAIASSSPFSPADNATEVAVDSNIVLNFAEAVDAESGNITIHLTSDNSTIETIDVTGGQVSGSGTTQITINPTDFSSETEYYVLIPATAFDDACW